MEAHCTEIAWFGLSPDHGRGLWSVGCLCGWAKVGECTGSDRIEDSRIEAEKWVRFHLDMAPWKF